MKRFVAGALLVLSTIASAQEVPTSNPSEVWVKGRKLSHSWRDGRLWVPTQELQPLLNLSSEYPSMDLLKALEEKGGYHWKIDGARFKADRDPSVYSTTPNPTAQLQNRQTQARSQSTQGQASPAAQSGRLTYEVQQFTAETGYVRAMIRVTNEGPGASDPSEMLCQFQDGFGKTYATHKSVVAQLEPGQSEIVEAFSMTKVEDTSITPTNDNVAVNFFSLTNPDSGPTTVKEARQQAKSSKKKGGLPTFNQHLPVFRPPGN